MGNSDFGVSILGNLSAVNYDVHYSSDDGDGDGDGDDDVEDSLILSIDWDQLYVKDKENLHHKNIQNKKNDETMKVKKIASGLFSAVREAVSIWFNVTKSLECFEVIPAINDGDDDL